MTPTGGLVSNQPSGPSDRLADLTGGCESYGGLISVTHRFRVLANSLTR